MAADGVLTFAHGEVRMGGTLLPGIMRSQRVAGRVRFDEAEQDGLSGKTKTPLGWEDADVTIELELTSEESSDCYKKLAALDGIFRGHDNGGNPKVFDVVNVHAAARGINQVVFSGLDSGETDRDDVILATLYFVEHNPAIIRVEKAASASDAAINAAPAATTAVAADAEISADDKDPFTAGLLTGSGG